MRGARRAVRHRWAASAVSGLLIVAAPIVERTVDPDTGRALMVAASLVAGGPIAVRAARSLGHRTIGIELLVTTASVGALVIGEFWEAAAVTFLFAVGGALEASTLGRTRRALAELLDLAPAVAVVVRDGEQVQVAADQVGVGETVLVKNGAKVPVDGEVIDGRAVVDEAGITGESIPADKGAGAKVFAGTVSRGGFIRVRATGVGADTTLARVVHRVEEAQEEKARAQRFIERFSRWYTPGIMVLAAVAGLLTEDVVMALTLLVISCPGALVISMPVSIVAGIGRAARSGILIKGGEHLETAARVTAVALDKTGTLTRGRPRLTDLVPVPGTTQRDLLGWAALAEAGSEHPLARPVLEAAREAGLPAPPLPDQVVPHPGKGVQARSGTHRIVVGSLGLLAESGIVADPWTRATVAGFAEAGRTPMAVALDGAVLGVIAMADEVRADAAAMVRGLRDAGVRRVVMLTGDDARVARAVAATTGVAEVRAGLLPEDKLAAVRALQAEGQVVAMVGDGVNDAPALATADVGIAMGAAGSDVALETADLALMSDNLMRLPEAIRLSRLTVRNLRQNAAIALVTVAVLLSGVLLGGVTMAIGMFVHQASVLVVIVNGMRLLRIRPRTVEAHRAGAAAGEVRPATAGSR
ncbi:heavy metal translocating P-type ATPase [Actinomadura formosensis]|uniref:heavy metal translocating P-type ATPase n=1 Tax=Actinomadura formosensis TaxID=60706 RepID=UPI0008333696|nr:cation-translocating P-type ATPase [Actinomadura formosensis]